MSGCREPSTLGPGLAIVRSRPSPLAVVEPSKEPEPERAGPPARREPPEPYRVRSGDVLVISVLGEPDMTRTVPVGPDGRISYYIARDMVAAGRTFEEIRRELEERLGAHFVRPEVTVTGKAYTGNTATVLGQVRRPGKHVVSSDTRLLDVIAQAGGIARSLYSPYRSVLELADLRRAFVMRGDRFLDVNFEAVFSGDERAVARSNVFVRAGDTVYIPSALRMENKVFVLGAVASPRVVRFQGDVSLLEAVAEAGGPTHAAWERRVFVVRGSLKQPTVIPANLRNIGLGRARDVRLRAGDIVYVPKTALGKIEEISRQILPFLQTVNNAEDVGR